MKKPQLIFRKTQGVNSIPGERKFSGQPQIKKRFDIFVMPQRGGDDHLVLTLTAYKAEIALKAARRTLVESGRAWRTFDITTLRAVEVTP